mmetsp:Transcript_54346/g.144315  ORF Transcript_54346/g.144315 Transcript_54346/m.144315 type:complete len:241 (-) Transcript_54346:849-1571(-)
MPCIKRYPHTHDLAVRTPAPRPQRYRTALRFAWMLRAGCIQALAHLRDRTGRAWVWICSSFVRALPHTGSPVRTDLTVYGTAREKTNRRREGLSRRAAAADRSRRTTQSSRYRSDHLPDIAGVATQPLDLSERPLPGQVVPLASDDLVLDGVLLEQVVPAPLRVSIGRVLAAEPVEIELAAQWDKREKRLQASRGQAAVQGAEASGHQPRDVLVLATDHRVRWAPTLFEPLRVALVKVAP